MRQDSTVRLFSESYFEILQNSLAFALVCCRRKQNILKSVIFQVPRCTQPNIIGPCISFIAHKRRAESIKSLGTGQIIKKLRHAQDFVLRQTLGSSEPSIPRVPVYFLRGTKRLQSEADHSYVSSRELYLHSLVRLQVVTPKHSCSFSYVLNTSEVFHIK
jgi:hypothetical protein